GAERVRIQRGRAADVVDVLPGLDGAGCVQRGGDVAQEAGYVALIAADPGDDRGDLPREGRDLGEQGRQVGVEQRLQRGQSGLGSLGEFPEADEEAVEV